MNLLDAVITKIISNYVIDTKIEELGHKRVIMYEYDCEGSYRVAQQYFNIDEEWQKEIYVGKKIVV